MNSTQLALDAGITSGERGIAGCSPVFCDEEKNLVKPPTLRTQTRKGAQLKPGSISRLISQIRRNSESAKFRLLSRYRKPMQGVARRGLGIGERAVADEDDVVIVAFMSFLDRMKSGGYGTLSNRDDLWRLLARITMNHARKQATRLSRIKRGRNFTRCNGSPENDFLAQLASGQQTPDEVAEMADLLQQLLGSLPDDELREIVMLRLSGHTNAEIANSIGKAIATVERRLRIVRLNWSAVIDKTDSLTEEVVQ